MNLETQIEAVLFWYGEPISLKKLAKILNSNEEGVRAALSVLEGNLNGRGIRLVFKEGEVTMVTSPEVSVLIETLAKEELSRDLGKAGLETIAIILYQGPISRREIDYVRGVNSNFILRNLLVRGLIEKITNPKDERSFLYRPSFELLTYLGIGRVEDMPHYQETRQEIEAFKAASAEGEQGSEGTQGTASHTT